LDKAVCIAKKDAKIYCFGLQIGRFAPLIPAFVYLSFSLGREAPPDLPVLGLVVLVFGVSSADGISIPIEREVETCELLQRAPVSTAAIVFDESLVGSAFSIVLEAECVIRIILGVSAFSALGCWSL